MKVLHSNGNNKLLYSRSRKKVSRPPPVIDKSLQMTGGNLLKPAVTTKIGTIPLKPRKFVSI